MYVVQMCRMQDEHTSVSSACDLSIETTVNQPYDIIFAIYRYNSKFHQGLQQDDFDNRSFNSKDVKKQTSENRIFNNKRI